VLCVALEMNMVTVKLAVVICVLHNKPRLAILSTTNTWNLRNRFSVLSTGREMDGSRESSVAFHIRQKFTDFLN
jgi:hypothetical protein